MQRKYLLFADLLEKYFKVSLWTICLYSFAEILARLVIFDKPEMVLTWIQLFSPAVKTKLFFFNL